MGDSFVVTTVLLITFLSLLIEKLNCDAFSVTNFTTLPVRTLRVSIHTEARPTHPQRFTGLYFLFES